MTETSFHRLLKEIKEKLSVSKTTQFPLPKHVFMLQIRLKLNIFSKNTTPACIRLHLITFDYIQHPVVNQNKAEEK